MSMPGSVSIVGFAGCTSLGYSLGPTLAAMGAGLSNFTDQVAVQAVGSAVMFLIWFVLAVMWFACILPERWFSKPIPDWLSVTGLVLPAADACARAGLRNA